MELYKKYRPNSLNELYGQGAAVAMINEWIKARKVPHAILLTGNSGVGKTTIARILRSAVGCHDNDYHESNCADARGIDDIRGINAKMRKKPFGKAIVYCMDECHQLPAASQNILLKMLEDTPKWVYFLLCTTDPQKIIKTVKTRCSSIQLESLSPQELEKLILSVAKREGLEIHEDVIDAIVNAADGSARQALVLLSDIADVAGRAEQLALVAKRDMASQTLDICRALMDSRTTWADAIKILNNLDLNDPEPARRAVLGYAAACLLKKDNLRAVMVIDYFERSMYESGRAGFIFACRSVIVGRK
jgi:DNA polymerase-3 subunit gamma/tau